MAPRYTRRPGRGAGKSWKRKRVVKKAGACSMSLPAAIGATLVALARLVLINQQIGGAR